MKITVLKVQWVIVYITLFIFLYNWLKAKMTNTRRLTFE